VVTIGNLMRILKMCLKLLLSHPKWVWVVSSSSKFDTAFIYDATKFCSIFSGYWIGYLVRILKVCVKH